MSRTRFWTILIGTEPTAFRAGDRDALIPTLKQLQRRHPEAVIKWYEYGRIFESQDQAEAARTAAASEKRSKDWRPGGEHRDPRAKYKIPRDEKRRRFKLRQRSGGPAPERSEGGPRTDGPDSMRGARPAARPPKHRPDHRSSDRRGSSMRPSGQQGDRKATSTNPQKSRRPASSAWNRERRGPKKPRGE